MRPPSYTLQLAATVVLFFASWFVFLVLGYVIGRSELMWDHLRPKPIREYREPR